MNEPTKTEKPRSRRAVQKDVDIAFYALIIDAMHAADLHEVGTGLPFLRAAEILRDGQARGITPSAQAVRIVADELAGKPIVPTSLQSRRASNLDV